MSNTSYVPLHVYEVLEEEFISLQGPIPDGDAIIVRLPQEGRESAWRVVTAKRDWDFHSGHIKNPTRLATELGPMTHDNNSTDMGTYSRGKDELKEYIRGRALGAAVPAKRDSVQLSAPQNGNADAILDNDLGQLERLLNDLLPDAEFYRCGRFEKDWLIAAGEGWLSPATKSLLRLRLSSSEEFRGRDLVHLNRLVLEDLFPEALEKISAIRLAAIHQRMHGVRQKALCLSGGGTRSGTFALGLIQGLARRNLLKEFDYLSTVSGGGYIGSWLTAWIHRHPDGLQGVTNDLANNVPSSKIDPDPDPIHYLRTYSSFLTPKVGLLTADTWAFVGIYLRNLFLNWSVIIPLIVAVLMLPRLLLTLTLQQPDTVGVPDPTASRLSILLTTPRSAFLLLGFVSGVCSLAYVIFNRPGVREQLIARSPFWRKRMSQGSFLLWCLLPLLVSAFSMTTYWAWSTEDFKATDAGDFLLFGGLFTVSAWIIASLILRRLFTPRYWNLYEVASLLFVGLAGGLMFWLFSLLNQLQKPIIPYKGTAFPWTDWGAAPTSAWITEWYICVAVPLYLLVFLLGATLFVGVSSYSARIDDEDREWWARLGAWVLIAIIGWSAFTTLVIFGPIAILESPKLLTSIGGVSGLLAIFLGRSSKTPGHEKSADASASAKGGIGTALTGQMLPLLALIFAAAFMAVLSLGATGILQGVGTWANRIHNIGVWRELLTNVPANVASDLPVPGFDRYISYIHPKIASGVSKLEGAKIVHMNVLHHTSTWVVLAATLITFWFGIGLSRLINLNIFSLHGGYRNRLIRAFLGASRPDHERRPNPFTGFDPADNLHMHELRPSLFDEADFVDPQALVLRLQDEKHPLSNKLIESKLLSNVKNLPVGTVSSARLVAALRNDLNSVLETLSLHTLDAAQEFLRMPAVATVMETLRSAQCFRPEDQSCLRSDYQILLGRLVLEQAYPGTFRPGRYPSPPYRLMHVINTTLNLVGGDNLAWQQRKAEPFSISPLHSGCFRLGYRSSRVYGGRDTGGISIGTAAAISGAAASSNMGYYTTSPVISLMLTLFNVRLGWWLGNPGPAGDQTYDLRAPKYSVAPIIDEALGLTNDNSKYVYLTDGGHFENLALYEMVLRRCHIIVVSDGAQDEEYRFSDLGNAVRKIRIDFGVPIEFSTMPIYAKEPKKGKGMYWAIGKIRYSCVDGPEATDGVLLYIKPAVYGQEPRDILEYKESHPSFPHQTTADQFFDEPQFESYRMLGSYIMEQLCGEGTGPLDAYELIECARTKLTQNKSGSVTPQQGNGKAAGITTAVQEKIGGGTT
jgi:hypothetical protein